MNRQLRRKKNVFKEHEDKLIIAGLRVVVNDKTPDSVMVVSPKEGERLAKMVADAQAKQQQERLNQKEGK